MNEETINKPVVEKFTKNSENLQRQRSRSINPFEEMDRLFESFFPRNWVQPMGREWPVGFDAQFVGHSPKVDVLERDDVVVVKAELPGVDKDNIDISMTEDHVTINANSRQEKAEEKGDYHRREITQGRFSRMVSLPESVQSDKAKATFENGVLELVIPKAAPAQRRSIKVE